MELVSLEEMLEARDRRALLQKYLIQHYGASLIYLTMNIPGPVKWSEKLRQVFQTGREWVETAIAGSILERNAWEAKTGCEAYWVVRGNPSALKKTMIEIEDRGALGRLLDLDVLDAQGKKLSREVPRKCLICDRPALICARSRAHGLPELDARIQKILAEALL